MPSERMSSASSLGASRFDEPEHISPSSSSASRHILCSPDSAVGGGLLLLLRKRERAFFGESWAFHVVLVLDGLGFVGVALLEYLERMGFVHEADRRGVASLSRRDGDLPEPPLDLGVDGCWSEADCILGGGRS